MTITVFLWGLDGLGVGECESTVEGGEESSAIACSFSNLSSSTGVSIAPLFITRAGSGGISSKVDTDEDRDFSQYFDEAMSEETGEEDRVLVLLLRCEGFLPLFRVGGRLEAAGLGTPRVFLWRLENGASPNDDLPRM